MRAFSCGALLFAAFWLNPASSQMPATDTILLRTLAPELQNARALTADDLAPELRLRFSRATNLGFRFEKDLNGDGIPELLLVGDYGAADSRKTFALIASAETGGWSRKALFEFPGKFIVGVVHPDNVGVAFCLGCDYGGSIAWTGMAYRFQPYQPGPQEDPSAAYLIQRDGAGLIQLGMASRTLVQSTGVAIAALPDSTAALQPATAASNAFAIDLYRRLAGNNDSSGRNLWFSPWSIASALAMTAEGTRGSTLAQMAKTLRFGDVSRVAQLLPIHEGMAALARQFDTDEAAPYQLVVANALWGDRQYPFDRKYVDTIKKYYAAAGVSSMDFQNDSESARARINAWVEEQTRQKVTNLVSSIDASTRLMLTNAVYFKGSWAFPFTGRLTSSQLFRLDPAKTTSVPLMRMGARLAYMENDQLQMLSLPFEGRAGTQEMVMIVVLPRTVDGLMEVEKSLTAANLDTWLGALSTRFVQAYLPKFRMTDAVSLGKELAAMGMPDAFGDSSADFSGMSPLALKGRLHIDQVRHKAFLAIDENGAEAAAATIADVKVTGLRAPMEDPAVFRADHPFMVLLRHNPTGTILFLGRVTNPQVQ